ncbi:MAG: C39 family peptidase [Leadbetterella sp.]|nr:C39 family peptidase [Leadbetterella sp.]
MNKILKVFTVTVIIAGVAMTGLGILAAKSTDVFYKIPNFRLYGQQLSNWCWAAGTQMVNREVTGIKVEQQDIVKDYFRFLSGGSVTNLNIDTTTFCLDGVDPASYNIGLSQSGSSSDFLTTYFKNKKYTIKKESFNSTKTYTATTREKLWKNIKKNIFADQPVILNGTSCTNCGPGFWRSHMLVCTGFLEYEDQKLLYIQDPWRVCEGCQYYLSYNNLWKNSGSSGTTWQVRLSDVYYNINIQKSALDSLLGEIRSLGNAITSYLLNKASNAKASQQDEILTATAEIEQLKNTYQIRRSPDSPITVIRIINPENGKTEGYWVRIDYPDGTSATLTLGVSDQSGSFLLETYNGEETMLTNCIINQTVPTRIENMVLLRSQDNVTAHVGLAGNPVPLLNVTLKDLDRLLDNPDDPEILAKYSRKRNPNNGNTLFLPKR